MPGRLFTFAALMALLCLYGSATLAPFLANDQPWLIEAVDHGAYDRARTELRLPVRALLERVEAGEAAFLEQLSPDARIRSFEEALALERDAVLLRTATMRRYLPEGGDTLLRSLETRLDSALGLVAADRGEEAAGAAREAFYTARLIEEGLRAQRGPEGGPRAVQLVPVRALPLLESQSGLDVGAAVLFCLLAPIVLSCGLRSRRRPGRPGLLGRRASWVLGAFGLAVLAGAAFELSGPRGEQRAWKDALGAGELEVTRVVYPPLFMGFDETNLAETFRPPTWSASARIDAEGVWERDGAAAGGRGAQVPPQLRPAPNIVEVRPGEPARNAAWRHPLGTDGLGRDLLARMLWGGRVSLTVGLVSAALLLVIGVLVGALAGYHGGRVDMVLSRVIEVFQCFPTFFLIVTAVALIPERRLHPLFAVVIVIALVNWTGIARLVRAEFLRARELDYVHAARSLGLSTTRIVFGHVLPNVLGPVFVAAAFALASGVLIESGVSFLGFGVRHPVPSWGALLSESRSLEHWWLQLFPGLAIFATVLATHVLGESLRDALDPRTEGGVHVP